MKNTIQLNTEISTIRHASDITDGNSSELGSQAPCIGDDPHETNRVDF